MVLCAFTQSRRGKGWEFSRRRRYGKHSQPSFRQVESGKAGVSSGDFARAERTQRFECRPHTSLTCNQLLEEITSLLRFTLEVFTSMVFRQGSVSEFPFRRSGELIEVGERMKK